MHRTRTVGVVVAVGAAGVVAWTSGVGAPPGDAIPPVWPFPVTVLAAATAATGVHAGTTGRFRPASVAATAAVVLLAALATVPTFNYTVQSLSAPYVFLGVCALPAAIGAAAKRQRRRFTAALAVAVVALGLAASLWVVQWLLPHRMAAHLATSLPGVLAGYAVTVPPE